MQRFTGRNTAYMTGFLIALNILDFLYLEIRGSTEWTEFMIDHGAMYAPLILEQGEYYRLLTSIFMHFGIRHLVNNMLILFILGDHLERALGKIRYMILYLSCGVGANVISMKLGMEDYGRTVGAGASGAIFGVIGALFVVSAKNRGRFGELGIRQLAMAIFFSLFLGFNSPGVDNAAHVAGLLLGMLLALLLYQRQMSPVGQELDDEQEEP